MSAPTPGNWLIAMCAHFTNGPSAHAGWTLDLNVNAVDYGIAVAYRLAQLGDSGTQIPFTGNGAGYIVGWEIAGLTGTWATDKQQYKDAVDVALTGGTHYSTTSFNTSANNTSLLGLMGADNGPAPPLGSGPIQTAGPTYTGGSAPVTDVSTIQTDSVNRNSSFTAIRDFFASSGSAVQYTPTFPVTEAKGQYVLLALNGAITAVQFAHREISTDGGNLVFAPIATAAKPRFQIIRM